MDKTCNNCSKTKPVSEFYEKPRKADYSESLAGYSSQCKDCDKSARQLYVVDNKDQCKKSDRAYYLKNNYNLSIDDYNQLFNSQDGKCKTCETHQSELNRPLCVDHNHDTGKVRGLLCNNCNRAFGLLKENVKTLTNLITYKQTESADNTEQQKGRVSL